ncbi:MAG TPA: hypothetical protein ENJ82_09120 [Bacteroidetes bacterium]|nr:hypothetical protein [Bacteroidota bacterium]
MKHLMKFFAGLCLVFAVWAASPQPVAAQCPMCKAAVVANSGYGLEENKMAEGLNLGIFYLFVLPYLSIFGVGALFYMGYRKRKRAEAIENARPEEGE